MERRLNEGNRTTKVEKGKEPIGRGDELGPRRILLEETGRSELDIRKKTIEGLKVGDTFSLTRTFTEKEVSLFADLTHDYNPVHFEKRFARAKSFKGLICHGLLVASMISEIGGQIGWLASEMSFRFKKPVYPGETVHCHFTLTRMSDKGKAEAEAIFATTDGTVVLEAQLKGIVPGAREKEVMKAMVAEGDPTNKLRS
jgi:acyl dehydratase